MLWRIIVTDPMAGGPAVWRRYDQWPKFPVTASFVRDAPFRGSMHLIGGRITLHYAGWSGGPEPDRNGSSLADANCKVARVRVALMVACYSTGRTPSMI